MTGLRRTAPEDEPFLFALFAEEITRTLALAGLSEAQMRPLLEMQFRGRALTYAQRFAEAEDWIVPAEDGSSAGRLLLAREGDALRIVDIAILASERGRGLGSRVIAECQHRARAEGLGLALQVAPQNRARRWYERLGFVARRQDEVGVEMRWESC